jgi:hypothetical protein
VKKIVVRKGAVMDSFIQYVRRAADKSVRVQITSGSPM